MKEQKLNPKKVSESAFDNYPHLIFPNDLNAIGTMFGGKVLDIADRLAATVARLHSCELCVTLLVDSVRFLGPAQQGEILIFKAAVNRVWRTSMEIGVKVLAKEFKTGNARHIASAYFTFVAINEERQSIPIPEVIPETDDEKRRYKEAEIRRQRRKKEVLNGKDGDKHSS